MMQVSEEMIEAARKIIWGRDHNHLHGDDLIRAALEAALAPEGVILVEPMLSDGDINLLFGRDPYAPITPMQAMFREFYEKAVSSQQK
jgi:hypothetical protein